MFVEAAVDVDVVALETDEEVSLLVQLVAPAAGEEVGRPQATVVVVLDRSGSMSGPRLAAARYALSALVDRLMPTDNFGVVTFDDEVDVVVPAGPLTDRDAVRRAVRSITSGGATDLSAGYLRGLQEARRVAGPAGARVILISDGHANRGISDPDRLGGVAAQAAADCIVTTTLGIGLGYDEQLLGAIARSGTGAELFAEEPDSASAQIAGDVTGLLEQTISAASITVRLTDQVTQLTIVNDLPSRPIDGGLMIELGGFVAAEGRNVVITFSVPGMSEVGAIDIASLKLRYVTLPDLVEETLTIPVAVNVVPGDELAGRAVNPVVRAELVYQEAQAAKREASRQLQDDDLAGAGSTLHAALASVHGAMDAAPPSHHAALEEEASVLADMIIEATTGSTSRASKAMRTNSSLKSRGPRNTRPSRP